MAELRGKKRLRFLPEPLACAVEIVDNFTSRLTEADPAVAVQAEVGSFLLELAFILNLPFSMRHLIGKK